MENFEIDGNKLAILMEKAQKRGAAFGNKITDELLAAIPKTLNTSRPLSPAEIEEFQQSDDHMDAVIQVANAFTDGMSLAWPFPIGFTE